MNSVIPPVFVTAVGVVLGVDADPVSKGIDLQGLAALVTSISGLIATLWVIVKGSRKSLSAEDLADLLEKLDKSNKGEGAE